MIRRRLQIALTLSAATLACGGTAPSDDPSSGGLGGSAVVAGAPAGGSGASSGLPASGNGGTNAAGGTAGEATAGEAGGPPASGGTRAGAGGASAAGRAGASTGGGAGGPAACTAVSAVPEAVRTRLALDPFYRKYVDANGLPVLASAAPADESLLLACELLINMLRERDDVRQELIRRKARFAIIGKDEGTADIPEYGYRDKPQADIDYINQRARGLGGIVASCGEENILCLDGDRYYNESICVHEFSHTITTYGAYTAEQSFEDDLQDAYDAALASGILDDTYRNSNLQEYWAEGVQDWYDTNASSNPPNGVHNQVNTRVELATYDPKLYELVSAMFPEDIAWGDCHAAD